MTWVMNLCGSTYGTFGCKASFDGTAITDKPIPILQFSGFDSIIHVEYVMHLEPLKIGTSIGELG